MVNVYKSCRFLKVRFSICVLLGFSRLINPPDLFRLIDLEKPTSAYNSNWDERYVLQTLPFFKVWFLIYVCTAGFFQVDQPGKNPSAFFRLIDLEKRV